MPRFVLLYHDCPPGYKRPSHWDLMLAYGPSLRTWALQRLPGSWQDSGARDVEQREWVDAEQLADHRLVYLDYEGPISGERGRGSVTRIDAGTYEPVDESIDTWQIILSGRRIRGRVMLSRDTRDDSRWTLKVLPDC